MRARSGQVADYIETEDSNNFSQESVMMADMQLKLVDMDLAYQAGIARVVSKIQRDSEKF
ncbi:hypothetical protein BDD12DRAFT_886473 [Trichophaea hybrida]|nr:hypothetical protein BDD12DRAFT_886473 [Trichophaea hybrida]